MTACFCLLFITSNPFLALTACTLLGTSYALGTAYYLMYCTTFVPVGKIPFSIAITTTAMAVGQFLSTYCASALQRIMNIETMTNILPVLALVVAAGTALSFVVTVVDRKKETVILGG
jgi:hypothetical protein